MPLPDPARNARGSRKHAPCVSPLLPSFPFLLRIAEVAEKLLLLPPGALDEGDEILEQGLPILLLHLDALPGELRYRSRHSPLLPRVSRPPGEPVANVYEGPQPGGEPR